MLPQNVKVFISAVAIALTILGYIPYFRDILKGKTRPHVYTWFIWGLAAAMAFGLQVSAGAGVGSWVTLAGAVIALVIFSISIPKGNKDITFSDTIFFILASVALFLWLVVKQPVLSVILITLINMLGFVPTVRKSWNAPYSETLFTYELNFFRYGLSLIALQQYNIITWLYPATWLLANALFSIMLIVRRKGVSKSRS